MTMEGKGYSNLDEPSARPSVVYNISYLPGEVLETIFMFLDGQSITMCKLVCKVWKDHAEYLIQRPGYWFNKCLSEIPHYALLDLMDSMFPRHAIEEATKQSVDWFEVYKSWISWRFFNRSENVSAVKKASGLNGITAIKVSGNVLLASTCHGRGRLVAYNLLDDKWAEETVYVGAGDILDFELVSSDDTTVTSNLPENEVRERLFSSMGHNEIWIELRQCYIQLGKNYRYPKDKINQRISHSHGYQLTLRKEYNQNETTLILKKISSKKPKGPDLVEFNLIDPYSEIVQFWGNKVCLGQRICECGNCNFNNPGAACKKMQMSTFTMDMKRHKLTDLDMTSFSMGVEFFQLASWQGAVFFGCSAERKLVSYVSGQRRYIHTPFNEGRISCCHIYNEYLFMGTDRGLLLIYALDKPVEGESHPRVSHITPYETAAKQIRLPYCHINSIWVAESVHHKKRFPQVICSSIEDIYVVSIED